MHDKLRRLADMVAALLVHRLEATKKDSASAAAEKKVRACAQMESSSGFRRTATEL